MINLESLEIDHDSYECVANYNGFLEEGFVMTFDFDYDKRVIEAEEEVGIQESVEVENFTFWYIKFCDVNGKKVTFSDKVVNELKSELEDLIINEIKEK